MIRNKINKKDYCKGFCKIPFYLLVLGVLLSGNGIAGNLKENSSVGISSPDSHVRQMAQDRILEIESEPFVLDADLIRLPKGIHKIRSIEFLFDTTDRTLEYDQRSQDLWNVDALTTGRSITREYDSGAVAWNTSIVDSQRSNRGSLTLLESADGVYAGTLQIDGATFRIRPFDNKGHVLISRVAANLLPADVDAMCGVTDLHSGDHGVHQPLLEQADGLESDTSLSSGQHNIRMLVLYTPLAEARADAGRAGVIAKAHLLAEEMNQAYEISEVHNVTMSVAAVERYEFTETTRMDLDFQHYRNDSHLRQLRDDAGADIVHLIVGGVGANYCGLAVTDFSWGDSLALAMTADYCLNAPFYAGVHENGHLHGAKHHPDDPNVSTPFYPYAYGHRYSVSRMVSDWGRVYTETTDYTTVMAYQTESGQVRSLRFSNPDVSVASLFFPVRTGLGLRNNAKVLRNTAHVVSSYGPDGGGGDDDDDGDDGDGDGGGSDGDGDGGGGGGGDDNDGGGDGDPSPTPCNPLYGPCCDPDTGICYEPLSDDVDHAFEDADFTVKFYY